MFLSLFCSRLKGLILIFIFVTLADASCPANTTCAPYISYAANETSLRQGWTSQPQGRGTIDIIWQCSSTIFLCCWTALGLHVPAANWGVKRWYTQKLCMCCLGLIGPEFIFQLALGQWTSARRSVLQFRQSGFPQWTMKHAFLADMGGFALRPKDWVEFVLDAEQVHYLVVNGYVEYSAVELDQNLIEDKNKRFHCSSHNSLPDAVVYAQLYRARHPASRDNDVRAHNSRVHRLHSGNFLRVALQANGRDNPDYHSAQYHNCGNTPEGWPDCALYAHATRFRQEKICFLEPLLGVLDRLPAAIGNRVCPKTTADHTHCR